MLKSLYVLSSVDTSQESCLGTVVNKTSLSSFKPMYCSREYQASTRLSQQYEKSTSNHMYQS